MADIKVKKVSNKSIKVLDKSIKEIDHIKEIKNKVDNISSNNYNNVYEYVDNKIERSNVIVGNESVHIYNKLGKKSVIDTKNNIIKSKDMIVKLKGKIKNKRKNIKNTSKGIKKATNIGKKTVKTTTNTIKTSNRMKRAFINTSKKVYQGIKAGIKISYKTIKAIITTTKALIELLIAGGWIAVLIIIIICLISLLLNSIFGIFFSNEKIDGSITMSSVIVSINEELNNKINIIKKGNPNIEYIVNYNTANWKDILILYSVKQSSLDDNISLALLDDKKVNEIKKIFWDMNIISTEVKDNGTELSMNKTLIINITGKSIDDMINIYKLNEEEIKKLKELQEDKFNSMWNSVISGYDINITGDYIFPVGGLYTITQYYSDNHKALDIASNYGSNIYAISDGEVYLVKGGCIVGDLSCNGKGGNYIIIKHKDNRYYSVYMHLKTFNVKQDDTVSRGQIIGYMGNTGNVEPIPTDVNSTNGTHLHFVLYDGIPYNGGVVLNPNRFFSIIND